jgi:beta-mannanase
MRTLYLDALTVIGGDTVNTSSLISQGKLTTASSLESTTYSANFATDGNTSTRWSSQYSDPQWVMVDLGSNYAINRAVLNWETAYGKAYQLQVSADGTNWTTVYDTATGDGAVDDIPLATNGRFIRMYGTVRGTAWGYSLWEFQVYGSGSSTGIADTTAPNVSLTGPTNGQTVSGTITLAASAKDDVAVSKVEFYISGKIAGPGVTASPYNYSWDTTTVANGSYQLWAKAYDTAGNVGTSATVAVTVSNTAPAPTSSGKVYWGAWIDSDTYGIYNQDAPWSASTWDTFEQHAGKKVSIEHYGQPPPWVQNFASSVASLVTNRGAIPLIDMGQSSDSLTTMINGGYDSSIRTWASTAKSWGKPFFFRPWWEMNGTWFGWGAQAKSNPANYVAAWRHFHDVVASQGASNVTWVWCPNTAFSGSTDLQSLYPGDAYVDWTCMDAYNWGTNPAKNDIWRPFNGLVKPTYDQILAIAPSKPMMLGETASSEYGGSKSSWITDALTVQVPQYFPQIKAVVWFNWNAVENGYKMDWPIESSSSAQAAFVQAIASSPYTTNSYGNLPLLTKVPLP